MKWKILNTCKVAVLLTLFSVWMTKRMIQKIPSNNHEIPCINPVRYPNSQAETFTQISNLQMYVKSATFDPRVENKTVIRLWAITILETPVVFCHIKFQNNASTEVHQAQVVTHLKFIPPYCKWITAVVNCPLSTTDSPTYVYISTSMYSTVGSTWHEVRIPSYKPPSPPKYGICMSTLYDLPDSDLHKVVEWFEMQKMLGVHNVILYGTDNVSLSIQKALRSYQDSGFLILHSWRLPVCVLTPNIYFHDITDEWLEETKLKDSKVNCIAYHAQHLAYMDCLYRYVDDFTYLGYFDIDEYIIPSRHYTWRDMFGMIKSLGDSNSTASYYFLEACYDTALKESNYVKGQKLTMYMTTKEKSRSSVIRDFRHHSHVKSIIKPAKTTYMYIHAPEEVLPGSKLHIQINPFIGRMNHYRKPVGNCYQKNNSVSDNSMSKYRAKLLKNMERKLLQLNKQK